MANQKISQFTYTSSITGDELIGVAINGENKAISTGTLLAYADNTILMQEHEKRLNNLTFNLTANDMLTRETAEKVSIVVNQMEDMEVANNELVSYIGGAFEEIHQDLVSYVTQIQKNSDLIAHVESDMIKLSRAQGQVMERVASNTEVMNQHTGDIQNLHSGLMALSDTVDEHGNQLTYLSTYAYPVLDNTYERVVALEEGLSYTDSVLKEHMDASYAKFTEVAQYAYDLNEKVDSSYAYLNEYIASSYEQATLYADCIAYELVTDYTSKYSHLWEFADSINTGLQTTGQQLSALGSKVDENNTYINARAEKIEASISELDTRLTVKDEETNTRIDSEVVTINTRIDNEVETLNTKIDSEVATINTQIDNEVATLNNRITTNVKVLSSNIDTVKNELLIADAENYASLEGIIDELRTYVDEKNVELTDLIEKNAESIANNTNAITVNATNIANIQEVLANHYEKIQEHAEHLATHDTEIADHQMQLNGIKEDIDDLHADIIRNSTNIAALKDTVTANSRRLDEQSDQIHALSDHLHNLQDTISVHGEEIAGIKNSIDDINEYIENELKPTISDLLERVSVNEDNIAHLAWHESHPETSIWGTFNVGGLPTNCGYKSERTPNGCES